MQAGQPSRTALGAAKHRAVHQVLEGGRILSDPLALRILGAEAESALRDAQHDPGLRGLRLFIAVRSRFAEDAVAAAVARGLRQLVVLGAGLDTFAYRSALAEKLRIFEVDHPATQAWKQERLAQAAIALPATLRFVPVDFERDELALALTAAGFDPAQRSFFTWLGVVPYLTESAIFSTLSFIASLPGGAQVVFDYANPPDRSPANADYSAAREALEKRVAAVGESLQCQFETDVLYAKLTALGLGDIEDLGPASIRQRYFFDPRARTSERGGHIVRAGTRSHGGQPRDLPVVALSG